MKVIGLLGGVASGKSAVAAELAALGAGILDADRAGHAVLLEPAVERQVRDRWGPGVFDAAGRIDRRAVAKIVFAPPPAGPVELAALEAITHPRIAALLEREIAQHRAAGTPAVVLDAAVMQKAGWDRYCDEIWFVDVPFEVRQARAAARGWGPDELAAREAAQPTLESKRALATRVIDNGGSREGLQAAVRQAWQEATAS